MLAPAGFAIVMSVDPAHPDLGPRGCRIVTSNLRAVTRALFLQWAGPNGRAQAIGRPRGGRPGEAGAEARPVPRPRRRADGRDDAPAAADLLRGRLRAPPPARDAEVLLRRARLRRVPRQARALLPGAGRPARAPRRRNRLPARAE